MDSNPTVIINNIYFIKINSFENASAFNIGENYLVDWSNSDKRNQGFGQNSGDTCDFLGTKSGVDDRDVFDSNAYPIKIYD
ncbi:hypothetical protein [Ammoniphilus sp. CFH 90114]|uniref:hypothetical protein n=1 Tax=Ammoniphilus sp. CFH 90114 TaxID=2493665 RepID=UPI001F0C0137|nr:hypothetical protein [Ammoniphilus sp. CFH 90114]